MSLCVLHRVQEPKSEVVMPRLGGKLQVEVGFSSSGGSSPFFFLLSSVSCGHWTRPRAPADRGCSETHVLVQVFACPGQRAFPELAPGLPDL